MVNYRVLLPSAVLSFSLLVLCHGTQAAGDQNAADLDGLFSKLQHSSAPDVGLAVTRKIWEVWHQAPDAEAQLVFDRGVAFMAQSDYRSSLIAFTRVTEMAPRFAEAWNRRATLLYLVGAFESSVENIQKTLDLEPRHFGAISGLGQIYLRQDKLSLARQAFEKALSINPHLEGARTNIKTIDRLMSEKSI